MKEKFHSVPSSVPKGSKNNDPITIVQITSSRLEVFVLHHSSYEHIQSASIEYTQETLAQQLKQLKKEMNVTNVRILLPEDSVYVLLLKLIDKKDETIEEQVKQEIHTLIPENIQDLVYSYKILYEDSNEKQLQVLATHKENLYSLYRAAQAAELAIDCIESPSVALARATKHEDVPQLLVQDKNPMIAIASFRGAVIEATTLTPRQSVAKHLTQLVSYVQREYGVKLKKLLYDEYSEDLTVVAKKYHLDTDKSEFDIINSIAKVDVTSTDSLNLILPTEQIIEITPSAVGAEAAPKEPIEKVTTPPAAKVEEKAAPTVQEPKTTPRISQKPATKSKTKKTNRSSNLLSYVLWSLVIAAVAIAGFFLARNVSFSPGDIWQAPSPTPQPTVVVPSPTLEPTQAPTPTVEPSPVPVPDRSALSIQVLNGNGQPGAANDAQAFLQGLGYQVPSAGNATRWDYQTTEIRLKPSVSEQYQSLLQEDLTQRYQVSIGEPLDEANAHDAVVTVGAN